MNKRSVVSYRDAAATDRGIHEEQFSGVIKRLGKKINIDVSPHRFRHTFGTEAAKRTDNIKVVKEQMGHSSIRTTYEYVHPDLKDLRKLGAALPQL